MLRIPRRFRPWVLLFALWIALEPLTVTVLRAKELPGPEVDTGKVDGISNIDEVLSPVEYLEYILDLRGRNKAEAEAKAWGDWLMQISGIYMMMDAGSQDVFSFYSAMKAVTQTKNIMKDAVKYFFMGLDKAALLFAFMGRTIQTSRALNALNGFAQFTFKASAGLKKFLDLPGSKKAITFIQYCSPPPYWDPKGLSLWKISSSDMKSAAGMKSYYRWVKGKFGAGDDKFVMSNTKGIARSVGIGFAVLGLVLSAYKMFSDSDYRGGRFDSYAMVKNYVDVFFAAAGLVAMFCVPLVGQVLMILTVAWMVVTWVGNLVGEHNKKWKEAYKNSFWYLYQNDLEFKSFYDNRANLKREEKAASLLLAEQDYGEPLKGQTPKDEDEQKIYERGKSVFEALEKQGITMTYYNKCGFDLPDYDMARMMDLWHKKADYMSWKPNEQEATAAKKRGLFGRITHAINPKTWVSWVGDKIDSRGYKNELKNDDIKRVYFNPDYFLIKKYKNFLIGKNLKGGIYDVVGIRIEQSPFNYAPLIGIDTAAWTEDLLGEAFNGDAFIVGSKEMTYFTEQIKGCMDSLKQTVKEGDEAVSKVANEHMPYTAALREALIELAEGFQEEPDAVREGLGEKLREALGWSWNPANGEPTPRNIIKCYKGNLEQLLAFVPTSMGQKAADLVLVVATIKHNLDTSALIQALYEEKKKSLNNVAREFKCDAIRKYLKEGTFLDVKGSTFMDWLGGVYPAWEELRKATALYKKEADKFAALARRATSNTRDGFLGIDYTVKPPQELLEEINREMDELRRMVLLWREIKDQVGIRMPMATDERMSGIFKEGGFQPLAPLEPMNLDDPVAAPPPGQELVNPLPVSQ